MTAIVEQLRGVSEHARDLFGHQAQRIRQRLHPPEPEPSDTVREGYSHIVKTALKQPVGTITTVFSETRKNSLYPDVDNRGKRLVNHPLRGEVYLPAAYEALFADEFGFRTDLYAFRDPVASGSRDVLEALHPSTKYPAILRGEHVYPHGREFDQSGQLAPDESARFYVLWKLEVTSSAEVDKLISQIEYAKNHRLSESTGRPIFGKPKPIDQMLNEGY